MDVAGEVNVAQDLRRAGLNNVKFYAPQGYDPKRSPSTATSSTASLLDRLRARSRTPSLSPGLQDLQTQMKKPASRSTSRPSSGWINADLLYKGIKKAGTELHPEVGRRRDQQHQRLHGRRHPAADQLVLRRPRPPGPRVTPRPQGRAPRTSRP